MGDARVDDPDRVTVLGTTTVGGVALTKRQRAIVAALALHEPRGASTEALIDAVWTDDVPRAARQSLQNQITRLRRQFGADLIETDPAGYRLRRPTDVGDFEDAVSGWLGRPASPLAVTPLESGLTLWQGTPYADLPDHHAVEPERTRLEELHAQAGEHLAVCRMTAGDLRGATTDLAVLVEHQPYREHRWGLLMLALHLDRRRADALAVYQRAAERFARDLGTQPSAAMRRLRSEIEQDSPIDLTRWAEVEVVAAVPACGRERWRQRRCTARPLSGRPD